ncbi:hypothetical protein Pelo_3729 [Pelomyxa schiedti]|nr:hypothetical protein Pelo_3729 [Pelomyxa schiedti]
MADSSLQLEADCLCEFKNMGVTSWTTGDPCTFSTPCEVALNRVVCWGDGHLKELSFYKEPMQGTLPSCISAFGHITYLSISVSNISGTLPPAFYNLTTLEALLLSSSLLEGTISPQLSHLVNLQTMHTLKDLISLHILPRNIIDVPFQGPILDYLVDISTISYILFVHNQFTGTIPDLSSIGNLNSLILMRNEFSGSLPYSLGSATLLSNLNLVDNNFTGSIPSWVINLSSLTELYLNH